MDRLVVEVGEEEVAVRGPDTAGAKAVAADAKTASATTTRGVREIMTMCTSSSEDQARRSRVSSWWNEVKKIRCKLQN